MKRGTQVGKAYVAVTADGTGINEEIVDSVDKAGPDVEKSGDRAGKRYGTRFSSGFRSKLDGIRDRLGDRLEEAMARAGGKAGTKSGDEAGKNFSDGVLNRVREVGSRIGNELSDRLASNPEQIRRGVGRAFNDEWADRIGERLADRIAEKLGDRIEEVLGNALVEVDEMIDRVRVSGNRGGGRRDERSLGDRIGGLLGGGSRNNFLNLFGRSMGNLVDLVDKVGRGAGKMFEVFKKGFTETQEGASFLQKTLGGFGELGTAGVGGIGKGFSAIAASGPAAAASIIAVVGAMSIMVSVVGALTAIITALVATIASALVGALAVAGGAMLALVAAGGLLTAAFMSMTDAQKALLKDAFMPLKAEMVGIGQVMLQEMVPAFQTWSRNLQEALVLALPVAQVLGKAFADAGSTITKSFSGPGFQRFADALSAELPAIINNLSSALGGFLNGALGLFSAIMPYVTEFSQYLADVAARFSAWANSADGQNSISDFVGRALTSLESLWGFLSQFGGLFSDLFFSPQAQEAGNTIFDSMARTFERFRTAIATAAADGSLKRWFDDAIKFGGRLWQTIEDLFSVFKTLYSSGVLSGVGVVLSTLSSGFKALSKVLGPVIAVLGKVFPVTMTIALGPIILIFKAINALGDAIGRLVKSALFRALANIFKEIGGKIVDKLVAGLSKVWGWLGSLADRLAPLAGLLRGPFVAGLKVAIAPLLALASAVMSVANAVDNLLSKISNTSGYGTGGSIGDIFKLGQGASAAAGGSFTNPNSKIPGLVNAGNTALANTDIKAGGFKAPKEWNNPYKKWAESLIKSGPGIAAQIRQAIREINRTAAQAIRDATREVGGEGVTTAMTALAKSLRDTATQVVDIAQQGINSAAQRLASASSPKEAQRALRAVRAAQKNMREAIKQQNRINRAAQIVDAQAIVSPANVEKLVSGLKVQNATLADFAEARSIVADKIEDANQKLTQAIALRDDYAKSVADSIRNFGSLVSAQAQTINGVEQALTAVDVTSNLQDRLTKIQKFQENLRLLLAQGLSSEAYKQLVDAGVEGGSATAEALLQGGSGAIAEVNNLLNEINKAAEGLGGQAANRMYQAGVDAAQGLVDGLNSLSSELDSAATRLGNAIAAAVKKALGIKSPSTVMIGAMDNVGDGAVIGLDNQHAKVGDAARRFADAINVSPEAALAASASRADVSGNTERDIDVDITVITPTEDPHAVATEVMNEMIGAI